MGLLILTLFCTDFVRGDQFLIWNRTYGVDGGHSYDVVPSGDGGFVVYGEAPTPGIPSNLYLLKLDGEGNRVWDYTYSRKTWKGTIIGDPLQFTSQALVQSGDGGFVVAGRISPKPTHDLDYYFDMYFLKVDANGDRVWEKIYRAEKGVTASSIIRCEDGGFIVTGYIDDYYRDGFYVLKVDPEGNKTWDRAYFFKGSGAGSITKSGDGGYMILGGDDNGYFVVKIDPEGNKTWRKRFEHDSTAVFRAMVRSHDGFILAGETAEDVGSWRKDSLYLVGLDRDGNKTWEKTYAKSHHLKASDIIASGNEFIVVGEYGQDEQP
jgi:hypothetical protein